MGCIDNAMAMLNIINSVGEMSSGKGRLEALLVILGTIDSDLAHKL